jgi:putative alpha-1,2-mannosidase
MILKKQYHARPDGLSGNDDCGQMSAWYIFNSLGFYPVAPGQPDYNLGSPSVEKATIQLENGKSFTIEARNQSDKNIYVEKMTLNDKPLKRLFLSHTSLMNGGKLVFYMSSKRPGK